MNDGIIFAVSMGAVAVIGTMIENRKERKAMKARHDKRFKEIQENNRRRRGEL